MLARDHDASGFSTFEATIALAIVGGMVALAYTSVSNWLARSIQGEEELRAAKIAESVAARIGLDLPILTSRHSGESGGHTWRVSINRPAGTSASIFFHQLDIEVTYATDRSKALKVSTRIVADAPR